MMLALNNHIALDPQGVAYVAGTDCKVKEVIVLKLAWALEPEQIHRQLPHLSLAQIHSALAYYYDHQLEMDAAIAADLRHIDNARSKAISSGSQPARADLDARSSAEGR